jgi:hypothetical protein
MTFNYAFQQNENVLSFKEKLAILINLNVLIYFWS